MNLIIDIGNTSTKLAVFRGQLLLETHTGMGQSLEALPDVLSRYSVSHGILASVVELLPEVKETLFSLPFSLLVLNGKTPVPITNLYKTPQTLGYDRLAAVVGAYDQHPGKDALVVDIGTAITYEFIDAAGCYHGGNIAPGVQMRLKALNHYTGKLPLVPAEGETPLLGNTTETAIRSGVIKGIEFEIEGYITSLKHKYPELLVFLTGGDAFCFAANLKNVIFADSFLVLRGLNRILNYNNGKI